MKPTRSNNPNPKMRKSRNPNSEVRIPDSEVRIPEPDGSFSREPQRRNAMSMAFRRIAGEQAIQNHSLGSSASSAVESGNRDIRNSESGIRNPKRLRPGGVVSPVLLYPYQQRWVADRSRFKLVVKATQIGYSFAAALEAVLDCLEHPTLWIVLSRGERQSLEFMQKVQLHAKALRLADRALATCFFENTSITQHAVEFPNGSRIIGLPANPDTARGYTGNMILDEFAFHQHDREIWAAAFGRLSRGDLKLRVISTPNGQRGKFYELAKEIGLVDQPQRTLRNAEEKELENLSLRASASSAVNSPARHSSLVTRHSLFSPHWCDVHAAVRQGCPIDIPALRRAVGDEETWQQEYECVFLSDSRNYIPMDWILACQSPEATTTLPVIPRSDLSRAKPKEATRDLHFPSESGIRPPELESSSCSLFPIPCSLYFGYDVGRVRDLAVLAVVERVGDVFWTRALVEMPGAKFSAQEQVLRDVIPLCVRGAVDSTGLGMEMAERLAEQFPGKVEPLSFTLARKHALAVRVKRCFEEKTIRIPDHRDLRRDLNAVKRIVTSAGHVRFDAERTEQGHADRFWALALALHAADPARGGTPFASAGIESEPDWYHSGSRNPEFGIRSSERAIWDSQNRFLPNADLQLVHRALQLGGFA
jgi:phage FluMu gp28-like protein